MPTSPARLCRDCTNRAVANGYCADHQTENRAAEYKKLLDQHRADDPLRQLYRTNRWQATRRTVLRRDILCQIEGGCPNAATVVDHIVDARLWMMQGGDFYDKSNLRGLCKSHHDARTARDHFAGNNRKAE